MRRTLAAVAFLFCAAGPLWAGGAQSSAATKLIVLSKQVDAYYVDSTRIRSGNGRSPSAAFRTLAELPTSKFRSSTIVRLRRGCTWRESLSVSTSGLTIEAYGSGARPVLDCADAVPGSWTVNGTYADVYEQTIAAGTVECNNTYETYVLMWEAGSAMVRCASLAALHALDTTSVGGWYTPSDGNLAAGSAVTLYIKAKGGSAPSLAYEYSRRRAAVNTKDYGASRITIRDIHGTRALGAAGAFRTGERNRLYNCVASKCHKHHFQPGDGSVLTLCTAEEPLFWESASMYNANQDNPQGLGVVYDRCTATSSTYTAAAALTTGWYGHPNKVGSPAVCSFGRVVCKACSVSNLSGGFAHNGTSEFAVISPVISAVDYGVKVYGPDALYTGANAYTITGGSISCKVRAVVDYAPDGACTITGTALATTGDWTVVYLSFAGTRLTLSGCSLSRAGGDGILSAASAPGVLTVNGCTFNANLNSGVRFGQSTMMPAWFSGNGNTYNSVQFRYNASGESGGVYHSLAEWQVYTGQDADST